MESNFGVSIKFGSEFARSEFNNVHDAKAEAGKWFNNAEVVSAVVFDKEGRSWLYLKKGADGSCIKREEQDW